MTVEAVGEFELKDIEDPCWPATCWVLDHQKSELSLEGKNIGYGVPSDFELNFARYLTALGRADFEPTVESRASQA